MSGDQVAIGNGTIKLIVRSLMAVDYMGPLPVEASLRASHHQVRLRPHLLHRRGRFQFKQGGRDTTS